MADGMPLSRSASATFADEERAAAYRWLAGLFAREQTTATLAAYDTPGGRALLEHLGASAALAPTVRAMSALAGNDDPKTTALDLASAFAWLFHGVGGRHSAPPCASVYTGERGLIYQDAAATAAADLARLDIRLADDFSEPPDHVAVLLSVMATLIASGSTREQASYLDARLLPWIDAFRDACVAGDRHGFYAEAARSMAAFVKADRAQLETRSDGRNPITSSQIVRREHV